MNEASVKIRDTCLKLLASREHSGHELLEKLTARGFDKELTLAVIEELAEQGFQSDLRFSESLARSRILKGYGPLHIAYELRQKGIDLGDSSLPDLDELADSAAGGWMALLERVYLKKYGHTPVSDHKERSKRSRFLMQRGFSGSMIADFLKNNSNTF